jgi:hypothetical protein
MSKSRRKAKIKHGFEPGTFGWHEMVDRSCLIAELFSENIAQHPAAKHPKLRKLVKRLEDGLFRLYNVSATMHS